jgi:Protein of unknown function (DUF2796)
MNWMFPIWLAGMLVSQSGHAHVHGHGRLLIGAEADGRVEVLLEVPAESLWGFERRPATDAERAAIRQARTRLGGSGMVSFTGPADCGLVNVEIDDGGMLDEDHAHTHTGHGHHDVSVRYRFNCLPPARIRSVSTALFEAFPRLEELEAVFADTGRQAGFELTPERPAYRLPQ